MKNEPKTSTGGANGRNNEKPPNASASPLNGAKAAATSEFYTVLADIEYLVKDVANLTGDDLVRTSLQINEHVATARKAAEAMADSLSERAQQTIATTNEYVQRQPWKAIGIGTTIGLILGVMIGRR